MSDPYTEVVIIGSSGLGLWGHVPPDEAVQQARDHYKRALEDAQRSLDALDRDEVRVFQGNSMRPSYQCPGIALPQPPGAPPEGYVDCYKAGHHCPSKVAVLTETERGTITSYRCPCCGDRGVSFFAPHETTARGLRETCGDTLRWAGYVNVCDLTAGHEGAHQMTQPGSEPVRWEPARKED